MTAALAPTTFPPIWNWPRVPTADKVNSPEELNFLDELLTVLNDLTDSLGIQLNDEVLKNSGTQKMLGMLDLSGSTGFVLPVISGDWAAPTKGEIWFNSALDRMRGKTATLSPYSFPFYIMLGNNVALGNAVSSVVITFATAEPDTNYVVQTEVTWNTTVFVSAKGTGGVTLNFGTATPNANQKVSYWIVR